MATIKRFEDLEAWMKARELTRTIYGITGKKEFNQDYSLRDQIRRAAVSIMSNIAEGFERRSNKEFQHFLSIAKGSAGELRSQLYVALDASLVTEDDFNNLLTLAEGVSCLMQGLISYLHKKSLRS